jgi:hypothetical protein
VLLFLLFNLKIILTFLGYDVSVSPSLSRDHSVDCVGSGFYDNHDLWHYFGSVALLGQGILLFHLDLNARHEGINVLYLITQYDQL